MLRWRDWSIMAASTLPSPMVSTEPGWRERLFPNNEWALVLVLVTECVIFSLTGSNFLTASNAFEVTRLSVEIGLLALVLTPVIISGGIDLSVGSMMGLAAVVMGGLWRDAGMPKTVAADRKSTRLNSSHSQISYAVFCLK